MSDPIRVGVVGVGNRGSQHVRFMLEYEGVEVRAICDINEEHLARAQASVVQLGHPKPEGYSRGPTDWRRLCERNDLDLVFNATPWEWHAPISVAAMRTGKHAWTEVPAAITLEECWELVETSEKTGKHCIMMENACYRRDALMLLVMVRSGLLGDLLYAEGGYMHDLRGTKWGGQAWRLQHSIKRNADLYPTHPIGPMAWWMNLGRGDRMSYLVSMSTKSRSMHEFAVRRFGADDYRSKIKLALGDVVSTLIRTEKGKTITLWFDTNTARPKEHILRVQGTKGVYSFLMNKVYIEGRSPERGCWESTEPYARQYDSKLWRARGVMAKDNHGGSDHMQMYRLIRSLKEGTPPDQDVYDAADWSVITPLTELSIAKKNVAIDFPDFTRGKWKTRPPINPGEMV
jgi:predicted dehydrogenase